MNNYIIYKFTFSDGKVYIGQTNQIPEKRWNEGQGYNTQEVYIPITLDGWNNVQKEILHQHLTKEQADKLEKYYIKKFNSITNGYNRTPGGTGHIVPQKMTQLHAMQSTHINWLQISSAMKNLTSSGFQLFLYLIHCCNDNVFSYISKDIEKETGLSSKSVSRAKQELLVKQYTKIQDTTLLFYPLSIKQNQNI